jgi:citrate synthase
MPTKDEYEEFQHEIYKRGSLHKSTEDLIKSFPTDMHPMTQFSMGVLACQPQSHFAKAYREGVHKDKYWETTLEDALDVCAKVSRIAAIVFHNCYGDVISAIFII